MKENRISMLTSRGEMEWTTLCSSCRILSIMAKVNTNLCDATSTLWFDLLCDVTKVILLFFLWSTKKNICFVQNIVNSGKSYDFFLFPRTDTLYCDFVYTPIKVEKKLRHINNSIDVIFCLTELLKKVAANTDKYKIYHIWVIIYWYYRYIVEYWLFFTSMYVILVFQ